MSNLDNKNIRKMLLTDDNKCNFICGYSPEPELIANNVEIISPDKVDYMISNEPEPEEPIIKGEGSTEDLQKTLSYLSVKSVEEGINWYRNQFPKLPEELLPIIARYNWGEPITKKSVKNEKKKLKKKEQKYSGYEKRTGSFVVDFS